MDSNNLIRVMLVDDHDMVRQGLAIFIETVHDFQLVGQASNGAEAVRLVEEIKPHVILMDLKMPEMDGIQATRAIRGAHPDIQVVALTSFKDKELVRSALQAGAIGYILKNISIEELAEAVRDAYKGKMTLDPQATQAMSEITPLHLRIDQTASDNDSSI